MDETEDEAQAGTSGAGTEVEAAATAADGERRSRQGARRDRSALAALPAPPGLCATCVHLDLVGSKSSVFVRCGRSDSDPRFPRYPPLPVRRCAGWEAPPEGAAIGDAVLDRR